MSLSSLSSCKSFLHRSVAGYLAHAPHRLSWADTAASITGRLWGHLTPKLPSTVLYLPVASRKSLAGVFGSLTTAALTTMIFWGFGMGGMGGWAGEPVWRWSQPRTGGWFGLSVLGMGAGTVTSIAEVLGECAVAISFDWVVDWTPTHR